MIIENLRPPQSGTLLQKILSTRKGLDWINSLSDAQCVMLKNDWIYNARKEQYEPEGNWNTWVFNAGRGAGKTRSGAEWVLNNAMRKNLPVQALIAPTARDFEQTMINGMSGLKRICPSIHYQSHKHKVTFPNGNIAYCYSAEEPDRLRGPNFYAAWCDELTSWRYDRETFDMLSFALRLGDKPRIFISTTPKPRPLFKEILKNSGTVVTRGSTMDNKQNLSELFLLKIHEMYAGTRLGRQELNAELIEDNDNALWNREQLEKCRRSGRPDLVKIVIGVDPATTSKSTSDEAGIVAAGTPDYKTGYILGDDSMRGTPLEWAKQVVSAYYKYNASEVIAESNQGGEMVSTIIRSIDPKIPVRLVHASQGKRARAEPVSMLYEQEKVYHLGCFSKLEDEMCNWDQNSTVSPNRIDALVYAVTKLLVKTDPIPGVRRL